MSWEALYPGCDARFEDDRPFEVEWTGKRDPERAAAVLRLRGFEVAIAPSGFVTSCLPLRSRHPGDA